MSYHQVKNIPPIYGNKRRRKRPTFHGWFLGSSLVLATYGVATGQWTFAGVMSGISILALGIAWGQKLWR